MSYILESLKKSEKERNVPNSSGSAVIHDPPFLENGRVHVFSWKLALAITGLVFFLTILFLFLYQNQLNIKLLSDSQGRSITDRPVSSLANLSKEEAILLYEQALANKTAVPDVDSLYQRVESSDGAEVLSAEQTAFAGDNDYEVRPFEPDLERLAELETPITERAAVGTEAASATNIPSIYELHSLDKRNIPPINYGAHVFANDYKSGFVILNGARRRIGDKLDNDIFVEKITEDNVVLSYNGRVFFLPAMKSWAGY